MLAVVLVVSYSSTAIFFEQMEYIHSFSIMCEMRTEERLCIRPFHRMKWCELFGGVEEGFQNLILQGSRR